MNARVLVLLALAGCSRRETPPTASAAPVAATSAVETLLTHAGPVYELHQTRTHVAWAEPADMKSGRYDASLFAIAKATPTTESKLVTVPVDTRYMRMTALTSSATRLFLFAPGPGDLTYGAATVVDPSTRAAQRVPLPPDVSVFDNLPLAAAVDDTLVVASEVLAEGSTLSVLAPGAAPKTIHVDGGVTAIVAHDRDVAIVYGAHSSSDSRAARVDLAAGKLVPMWTRPKLVESIAVAGNAVVWSELEQDPGFRINSIFVANAGGAPRSIGKMEAPHHMQIAGDHACWVIVEPPAPGKATIECASLTTGAVQDVVGPLAQGALGFVVDEHHVYWAEITGNTTTLERRALP